MSYDSNGNLSSDGSTSYVYDDENRLVSASGGHSATLSYDPLGRLWQVSSTSGGTTQFVYDGDRLTSEYNGSGTLLRRYAWGDEAAAPVAWYESAGVGGSMVTRPLLKDERGSVIAFPDVYGNELGVLTYDEYGIPGSGNLGRFGYTGQAWIGELGMWYYKARMYSPTLGRFMQTDPLAYDDQLNLYGYLNNDPIDGRDPSGQGPEIALCAATTVAAPACAVGDLVLTTGLAIYLSYKSSSYNPLHDTIPLTWPFARRIAESRVRGSIHVYRVYGGTSPENGLSWTPVDPRTMANPRRQLGLPNGNKADKLVEGDLFNFVGVGFRPALSYDGNEGGCSRVGNYECRDKSKE